MRFYGVLNYCLRFLAARRSVICSSLSLQVASIWVFWLLSCICSRYTSLCFFISSFALGFADCWLWFNCFCDTDACSHCQGCFPVQLCTPVVYRHFRQQQEWCYLLVLIKFGDWWCSDGCRRCARCRYGLKNEPHFLGGHWISGYYPYCMDLFTRLEHFLDFLSMVWTGFLIHTSHKYHNIHTILHVHSSYISSEPWESKFTTSRIFLYLVSWCPFSRWRTPF